MLRKTERSHPCTPVTCRMVRACHDKCMDCVGREVFGKEAGNRTV